MKNVNRFRDNHDSNARLLKKQKMRADEDRLEVELRRLEVADKIASLLVHENRWEPDYAPRAY